MGAFFCVCVLPFKTKFLKKIIDEEMKMKMRERERERERERSRLVALFSSNSVLLQSSHKETKKKKKSLSLPQSSLPKSKVDNNNPPKSLFCLRKYISSRIHAV